MDNGMDSMLDTYLYETNSLLDQLDELLVNDEKLGDFSQDDVNEIFRIMHTIKGSSAMMEFGSLSSIAHHVEDLFFYIRDKGIESLDSQHKKELFNLMFRSEDCLRGEVEKVESGKPLLENVDAFTAEINAFLKKISGAEAVGQTGGVQEAQMETQAQRVLKRTAARIPLYVPAMIQFPMMRMPCAFSMFFWKMESAWKTCGPL